MKYLKLFESFDESKIDEICRKYNISNIVIDRLNDFLLTIGKKTVENVERYKNI